MKILLSLNGLIRNFKEAFVNIQNNIINNNLDCSFDIILNTSDYDKQISHRHIVYNNNFNSNTDINNYFNEILKKYNIINILFNNPIIQPGIPFDRIIYTYKNINKNDYDYIFFLRFDILVTEKIFFKDLNKDILYFFDGGTSNWFQHNKDIDYALLGNYKTLDKFLFYNIKHNYTFYDKNILTFIKNNNNNNNIEDILNIYYNLPFNSRWKKYTQKEKDNTIRILNQFNSNTRINGDLESIIFALYCKNLYDNNYIINILKNMRIYKLLPAK
tara:strand:- start:3501 stop:4319 length:819 start_codon:yes stop_codon:yes gene_type:complete